MMSELNDLLDDLAQVWQELFLLLAVVVTILVVFITSPLWVVPYLFIKRKRGGGK